MTVRKELVSQLNATLTLGLDTKEAGRVLRELQDAMLMPNGLFLSGGLAESGEESGFCPEIAGFVTRANGSDLSERDRMKVELWLAITPQVVEFSVGPLRPVGSLG